ncbi:MAG TPA: aminoacetone oxidase family FAD-binding enzyme [Verrucomicrobia bacterium]|nr:aminoacetone oxidase family FAD-binding enzyme [Verrucomicrobiota bacterium]
MPIIDNPEVIIIGGGAAGLFAAAIIAESTPARRVQIIEKGPVPLAKVRLSGGGRCNLTHDCTDIKTFVQNYPRGSRELIGPFNRFGPSETMQWFESHGVPLVTLADGCVFPRSDTAASVIQALLTTAAKGYVQIQTGIAATRITPSVDAFAVDLSDGSRLCTPKLLLANGGGAFIEGLQHTIEPCVPSLFTVNTPDREFTALAGIVVEQTGLHTPGVDASGALLITHTGISGPATLELSSRGARLLAAIDYQFPLTINWMPGKSPEDILAEIDDLCRNAPRKQIGSWFGLPNRLWKLLLQRAGMPESKAWGQCARSERRKMVDQIHQFELTICGKNKHREEFVTCGGIRLTEIDFKTMQSRLHPGLYLAGEVLDIDALTGGYNLQAAWTTGCLAAHAMVTISTANTLI